ncbi:MAG TPA: DUF3006 family protein [bacterium]|nr:DUF3006 family protein [bacterium]
MSKEVEKGVVSHIFTLLRFEDNIAVLRGDRDIETRIPKRLLPKAVAEGSAFVITIATEEAEAKRREVRAKDLLNEILNNSNSK